MNLLTRFRYCCMLSVLHLFSFSIGIAFSKRGDKAVSSIFETISRDKMATMKIQIPDSRFVSPNGSSTVNPAAMTTARVFDQ